MAGCGFLSAASLPTLVQGWGQEAWIPVPAQPLV